MKVKLEISSSYSNSPSVRRVHPHKVSPSQLRGMLMRPRHDSRSWNYNNIAARPDVRASTAIGLSALAADFKPSTIIDAIERVGELLIFI